MCTSSPPPPYPLSVCVASISVLRERTFPVLASVAGLYQTKGLDRRDGIGLATP